MHHIKAVFSSETTAQGAASDLKNQLVNDKIHTLVYFASSTYDQNEISASIKKEFPDSVLFGCSTAGEITSGKMLKNSISAMAFHHDTIKDIKIEVLEDIKSLNVADAFRSFENHFNEPVNTMDHKSYVGIVLMDGMSCAEEKLLDKMGDLTNVTFIGGSAGDDLKFQKTYVYANGKSYENAAVLALLKPGVPFDFIKTQSFKTIGKKLTVTDSNEETREVLEFNEKPAAQAYAEALGETVENAENRFMMNPLGLMINETPFVRSPQQIKGGSMIFYCSMLKGMEYEILESMDIISETEKAIKNKAGEMGGIGAIINFNCILRTLDLEKKGLTQAYADIFSDIPTAGFSTYGEAYIGHINQTATMLVFG